MPKPSDNMVHFKLGDYFRLGSHLIHVSKGDGFSGKVAIDLPSLVEQTNSFSTKNRPGCTPSLTKSNPKDLFLFYNVKCTLKNSDPNGHDTKIHFDLSQVTDETTAKNLDVAVSCSCPAFLYWGGQWNAHQRDALEGEARPLLTAPTERLDLRDGFIICKHIKAVSERILPSVQHNIVKILRQRHIEEKEEQAPSAETRLEKRQREMRERQKAKPVQKKRDEEVRKKLEQGIKNRDLPAGTPLDALNDVVKRDTPATPEERERVPVIPADEVPEPDAHAQHLHDAEEQAAQEATQDATKSQFPDIPEIEEFNDQPNAATPPPAVKAPSPKPQQLPRFNMKDREQMKRLQKEDQMRQQRETRNRLRNNPGRR